MKSFSIFNTECINNINFWVRSLLKKDSLLFKRCITEGDLKGCITEHILKCFISYLKIFYSASTSHSFHFLFLIFCPLHQHTCLVYEQLLFKQCVLRPFQDYADNFSTFFWFVSTHSVNATNNFSIFR